ncbi:transposase protein domain-containing protein [Phthorimaea operculella]|nr:transposase protein domain-containing protein [Phthorimaea operculella]
MIRTASQHAPSSSATAMNGAMIRTASQHAPSTSATAMHGAMIGTASQLAPSASEISGLTRPETPTSHLLQGTRSIRRRNRIVKCVSALTPRCKKLYRKCQNIIKCKTRIIGDYKSRLTEAHKLSEKKSFKAMVDELPRHTKTFLYMQVNLVNKHVKSRRFSNDEKLLALTLLKQSPKGYKLLQKLFILPSRRTLTTFTRDFMMSPGVNQNVLNQLKETVKSWDAKKRSCSVVFDEISLAPHLTYVESEDAITGFTNFGKGGIKKLCDHALVFMVRGVCSSWRQLVGFYYCEGTTPALTLKNILRGSTFQTCLKSFQADARREQLLNDQPEDHKIIIAGHKLNIIYDPPHLLKGIRNNLLTKDMSFCGDIVRWNDIVEVYKADCQIGDVRLLNKLNDEHIHPTSSQKMKVKNCTQVLSERMAAMLKYTAQFGQRADGTPVSPTMENTSKAVLFFDQLFDSVNGSRRGKKAGKLRGAVKDDKDGNNAHVSFWSQSIKKLENIFYFETTPAGHVTKKWVPTIGNWITTLKSFIDLWNDLKKIGVSYFYTRNLNQDPLENFFGRVRALNHRANQPDAYAFQCSFKSLLITNVVGHHSPHSNCEDDFGSLLFALQKSKANSSETVAGTSENAAAEAQLLDDDETEAQMAELAAAVEAAEAAEACADGAGSGEPRVGACGHGRGGAGGGGERLAHQPAPSGSDRAELFRRARSERTNTGKGSLGAEKRLQRA